MFERGDWDPGSGDLYRPAEPNRYREDMRRVYENPPLVGRLFLDEETNTVWKVGAGGWLRQDMDWPGARSDLLAPPESAMQAYTDASEREARRDYSTVDWVAESGWAPESGWASEPIGVEDLRWVRPSEPVPAPVEDPRRVRPPVPYDRLAAKREFL